MKSIQLPVWAIAAVVVVSVVIGFVAARMTGGSPDTTTTEATPSDTVDKATDGTSTTTPHSKDSNPTGAPDLQARIADLKAELEMQKKDIRWLEREMYGTPIPWPDDVDEKYRPEVFKRDFAQIAEECGLPQDLVGFDCDEPMCHAIMKRPAGPHETGDTPWYFSCAAWTDLYGAGVTSASGTVECADGSSEGYLLLGPIWEDLAEDDKANYTKRRWTRWHEVKNEWVCEGEESAE